jgi:hypothetical protein
MREITTYGLYSTFPGDLPPDTGAEALREQATALGAICERWDASRAKIVADPQLNDAARCERLDELARTESAAVERAIGERFGQWSRAELQRDIELTRAAQHQRLDPSPIATNTERYLARSEERAIADRLRGMSAGERYAAVSEAAERNDTATLRAARDARLVTPEQWARIARAHEERHHAQGAVELRRLERLAEVMDQNLAIARRTVRGEGRRRLGVTR